MAADNNDFTHEFQIYSTDLNAGTIGTGKFLLFDDNINALLIENINNIKIGGGEEGQVLVTDGQGNLIWATSSGGGGVAVNADWNSSSGASRILNKPDLTAYLPKSGGTLTGKLNAAQGPGTTGGYSFGGTEGGNDTGMFSNADGVLDFYSNAVKIVTVTTDGLTSTQAITLPSNPTSNLQAATKQYVDSAVSALNNFSGNYNDLTNKPTVATGAYIGTTQVAFNRASGNLTLTGVSIDGNAATVSNGVYTNGSYSNPVWITSLAYSKLTDAPTLAAVATSGAYSDLTGKPTLATVATSGSYSDLTNKPSIFSGSYTDLTNKPTLFDGAYLSLTGRPNLAVVATSGSYNDLSNKPNIPDLTGYATEAWVNSQGFGTGSGFSGSYNDLTNKPSIPTNVSDLTNDSGYITLSEVPVPTLISSGNSAPGSAVVANNTNVSINFSDGGSSKFVFNANGKLQLAAGGDIVDSNGNSVLGGGVSLPANASGYLTNDGAGNLAWAAGDGTFSGNYNDLTNKPTIPTDISDLTDNTSLLGGSVGITNEITNTDGNSTWSVSVGTNGVITMNTARGGIEFGAMPEVGGPSHLHIMRPAGQEGSTDLYFGDDYNYIKMPGLYGVGSQGVEIGSSYDSGSVSTWRFGTDGKLSLPTGGDIVDSNGASVLGGGSGNSLAPELTKSNGNLVANTTLEFQGTMYGCFFDLDSSGSYDVWLQTVTGDGADMSYAIGGNDNNYNFVYAFNGNGAVSWKVGLDRITSNELTAYGIKYHNGSLYLAGQYYNNDLGNNQVAVFVLNAEDGSVTQSWVLGANTNSSQWTPRDITVDSNNNPIVVGNVYGESQTITGLAAQAGSTTQFLVLNASDISSSNIDPWGSYYVHTDPNDSNAWYQVESVNTFRKLDTVTLTGTGTGLTVNLRYMADTNSPTGWRFDWCWIENGGSGYGGGDQVKVLGSLIGGTDGVDDVILSHNGWYMNILSTDAGVTNTQAIQPFIYNYVRFYTSQTVDYSGGNWDIRLGLNGNAFIWTPNWQHTFGGTQSESFSSVAVDSSNNVYAMGEFYAQDGDVYHRVLVKKLDSDGNQIWTKYVESSNHSGNAGSVAVDSNGNCIVIATDNNGYSLVTKLNTDGDVVWQSKQTNNSNWNNQPVGGVDADNNIIVMGSWDNNNYVTSIQKISGSDGSLIWARQLRNQQNYDMYEYYDEEAQAGKVVGNNIYYGGYCYDANDDQYVGFGLRVPTDGSGAGTYGRYIYSQDSDASWSDNTSDAVLVSATYNPIDAVSMSTQELSATTTANDVGTQAVHHYGIGTGGGMTGVDSIAFSDGSVQTTAYTGSSETITWTNPNNNTWRIATYNGGAAVSFNGGDTDACWFDPANSPGGNSNFRGAIIEYHAYVNSGTIVGTIHIASDYWNTGTVTHTESMSGSSNVNTCEFWYTDNARKLYFRRNDGNSENAMIQWTARCFYGQENNC